MEGYIAPAYRNDPLAGEFDAFLDEHCDWSADDFQSWYAWDTAIPPRDEWPAAVEKLNAHLATL